eukprot:2636808-Prymnesium_polylepis.2
MLAGAGRAGSVLTSYTGAKLATWGLENRKKVKPIQFTRTTGTRHGLPAESPSRGDSDVVWSQCRKSRGPDRRHLVLATTVWPMAYGAP